MPKLDESSRVIGRLEGKVDSLLVGQKELKEEVAYVKEALTNQRVEMSGLAGGISLITTIVVVLIKSRFFPGGG